MHMNTAVSPQPAPVPATGTVRPGLTEDGFLGGRLSILQPEKGFRAGIDSVFLAATVPCGPGETLFEAGIGTGVTSLCVAARVKDIHITGVEVSGRYAMIGEKNAAKNGFSRNINVITGDVKDALRRDLAEWPTHGSFSHAFANPPYYDENTILKSPNSLKAGAHAFGPEDLELWVKVLKTMVALRGTVTFVHRAESLGRLLTAMENGFGDIRVAPLHAREGMAATRVIVQGVKGAKGPLQLLPGLILHTAGSGFTPEAEAILRDGMAWHLR